MDHISYMFHNISYISYSYGIMDNFIICHIYIYTYITHILNIHISQDQDHASTYPQGTNCCNIGGLRAELAPGEEHFGGWTIRFPRENHGLSWTWSMVSWTWSFTGNDWFLDHEHKDAGTSWFDVFHGTASRCWDCIHIPAGELRGTRWV
jgi:hypothetical protein